jgi:tripartite-type tricarboxylate transporter receptor subunit TctC
LGLSLAAVGASTAYAESPDAIAAFYRGKTVTITVSTSPGGLYDGAARVVAGHIGSHIPGNPTIVVKNMPGAGSQQATNYLYSLAKKDGTEIGTVERGVIFDPIFGANANAPTQFDATKFGWLGSPSEDYGVAVAWSASGATSLDVAKQREVLVGATGAATGMGQFPIVFNAIAGTKFKTIFGYLGGSEVNLAMERGEIESRFAYTYAALTSEKPDWLASKKVTIIAQMGYRKNPAIPDVPWLYDLARNDEDRAMAQLISAQFQLGIPFLAPPGLSPDRLATLRAAFQQTMTDPGFRTDSAKLFRASPVSGEQIERVVAGVYATPPAVVEHLRALTRSQQEAEQVQKQTGHRP